MGLRLRFSDSLRATATPEHPDMLVEYEPCHRTVRGDGAMVAASEDSFEFSNQRRQILDDDLPEDVEIHVVVTVDETIA